MFERIEFLGISGTHLKNNNLNISSEEMQRLYGEPDRYDGEDVNSYNWSFKSNKYEHARYNIYTNDLGKTLKLGHNDVGEDINTFLDWLE